MSDLDPDYPYRGTRPDWSQPPPAAAPRRTLQWYRERSRDLDAVLAAAEAAAALTAQERT